MSASSPRQTSRKDAPAAALCVERGVERSKVSGGPARQTRQVRASRAQVTGCAGSVGVSRALCTPSEGLHAPCGCGAFLLEHRRRRHRRRRAPSSCPCSDHPGGCPAGWETRCSPRRAQQTSTPCGIEVGKREAACPRRRSSSLAIFRRRGSYEDFDGYSSTSQVRTEGNLRGLRSEKVS